MCSRLRLSVRDASPAAQLSRSTLIFYALPALPIALLTGPAMASLPNFYAADVGLSLAAVGTALTLARLWDTLADPVVGMLGDRTRTRLGRRKPWMIAGIPLVLIGAWFALAHPRLLTPVTLALASMVMYSGWTMIKLSHDAWGAELSGDYAQRVRITAWREAAGLLGGLLAIGFLAWGLAKKGPGQEAAYGMIYVSLAVLLTGFVALACWHVPAAEPARPRPTLSVHALSTAWRGNPALRKLTAAYFLNTLASALPATLFQAFVIHALMRPDLQGPLILIYSLAAIGAVPVWNWAARRFSKHTAWRFGMAASAAFFLPALLFREGDAIWFALVSVLTGICFAADLVLPPAIQADVLDEDRLASGEDRAGLLFAWLGLLNKFGYALAPGIAFNVLAVVDFSASSGARNSQAAIGTLAILYALVPVVLKAAAWWSLTDFPLDAARLAQVQAALNQTTGDNQKGMSCEH
jgi:glycoside/pentoside/hexuronide:cation symporter, GPH family